MKRFLLPLSLLIVLSWALEQPAEILGFRAAFLPMRGACINLTGALTLAWMGFCMTLALRPAWLERALGGLDKLYRAHKWAGIGAMILVGVHWLLDLSPRMLVALGWMTRGSRPPRTPGPFDALIQWGHPTGEWAAWGLLALGVVSLLRFVPYGWFRGLHRLFPVVFLIGAAHSIIMLLRGKLIATPFGALVLAICAAGAFSAAVSLAGRIGRKRRHSGQVADATLAESGALDLTVDPGARWPGHAAGQFALLTLDRGEGAHPFTIVSDWTPGARLRFAIKPLGDYTRTLPGRVRAGQPALVEGPYGRFDFGGDTAENQVWVAGGIGVAAFVARLEALACAGRAPGEVHFFYAVRNFRDASFPENLDALCARAGVELHRHIDERDGGLPSSDKIAQFAARAQSVWFCGPAAWAKTLRAALRRQGLPPDCFHAELFEFR